MNPIRASGEDYIQFLIGSPKIVSATEAARVQPSRGAKPMPAHDAFTRLLHRLEPDAQTLWLEVKPLIDLVSPSGVLIIDDSTLDKPRARHMELVSRHWSGTHHAVVQGINLITTVWSDGDRLYPCDYRIYHKAGDAKTKNDHFIDLITAAKDRGFVPRAVLFDSWYASLDNFQAVRECAWTFVTRFKANRQVRIDHGDLKGVAEQPIAADGTIVWLPGFGEVKVFRVVAPDGDTTHWATNDLGMDDLTRLVCAELSWSIEEYHRGLKQFTGVERCQVRAERGQRNHIGFAIRAFVRLEYHRFTSGLTWFAQKTAIVRNAVRRYLKRPTCRLPQTANA